MSETTPFEKLLNSAINVCFILVVSLPLVFTSEISIIMKKIIVIILFLIYKIIIIIFNNNISIGMMITKTRWKEQYSLKNKIIHAILYTLSFSTLLFWIFFPFDLFLINIVLLQIPTLYLKGTTFHGYFSGNMRTIK